MTLFVSSYKRAPYLVLEPQGRIGGKSSSDFYTRVKGILADAPEGDVILNLGHVDFIDSSGLGALVAINSHLARHERRLVLAGVMDNLLGLLKITNLYSILTIVNSVDDAFD
jgi:anti-sigma B factor antagonist